MGRAISAYILLVNAIQQIIAQSTPILGSARQTRLQPKHGKEKKKLNDIYLFFLCVSGLSSRRVYETLINHHYIIITIRYYLPTSYEPSHSARLISFANKFSVV